MTHWIALTLLTACGSASEPAAAPRPDPVPAAPAAAPAAAPPEPEPPKAFVHRRPAFRIPQGVTAVALDAELPTEVEVTVVADADLPPAITRTVATKDGKRRLVPVEHPAWKALTLPGRGQTAPYDVVILWPANPNAKRLDPKSVTGLPDSITPATITTVIDRDGDGGADLVWADWCCGEHTAPRAADCASPCGEVWEKTGTSWAIRERSGEAAPDAPAPAPAPAAAPAP